MELMPTRPRDGGFSLLEVMIAMGILAVGLTFPVVPRGDETIRFQINAAHTESDINEVLEALPKG